MARTFSKGILRAVTGSAGRFIAIAAIVALGCGFYAGLRMTCPDMKLSADVYYDEAALMDVRVVSTLGLDDADIKAISQIEGVSAVMGAYETDVMATMGGEQYAARVHSLPEEGAPNLNQLTLAEGRMPEIPDECVISADRVMSAPVELGDVVEVTECSQSFDETLATRTYKVVGFAHAPYYVASTSMGSTSLGSGTIQQFMYVLPSAFCEDVPYAEAFLLVDGASDEFAGSDAYQARVDEALARLEAAAPEREQARVDSLRADAQADLDDARAEYEQKRADAEAKLADAQSELDAAAAQIADSERMLASSSAQLDAARAQVAQGERDLASGEASYNDGASQLAAQRAAAEERLAAADAQLDGLRAAVAAGFADQEQLAEAEAQLAAQRAAAEEQLAAAQSALDAAASQLESARAQLAQGKRELASGEAAYASGKAQLEQGRAEYERGVSELADARTEAEVQFSDAEAELADAQAQIDELEAGEWLVMDRTKNNGAVSFSSDAERIDSIAAVFPFIFFLVAALVALTTMTRMVEEERVLVGTYKALGYSRAQITLKYLVYAAAASIIGAAAGIVVLSQVLPAVIMEAYSIIYSVPRTALLIDVPIALLSAGLGVGVTLFATWAAAAATLCEQPAHLMLPRAPKAGKRILLERIRPLWRRLSFSWKVTCRNLFRYKKRFVMTIVGIAGCTGLLLTGLGLQDSINDIIDKQFGELVHYNVSVTAEDDAPEGTLERVGALMDASTQVQERSMCASAGAGTGSDASAAASDDAAGAAGSDVLATVVVPENAGELQSLWTMRDRITHEDVSLGDASVVITEKLGTRLGIGRGDMLVLAVQDAMGNATNETYELVVTGVMENYIANYVFVGKDAYARTFGENPSYQVVFGTVGADEDAHAQFADAARGLDGVKTVTFNDETIDTYRTMLKSVNMVVVVLVVAAAALAFIVLYNLTNINITERMREIATLKVLGFVPREVELYIYRETILLTIVGCLVGLVFGVMLEGFVVVTAEVDYVMFGRAIHAPSFVVAFLLTQAFAAFVMFVMRKKLARVNMVESLKSNE